MPRSRVAACLLFALTGASVAVGDEVGGPAFGNNVVESQIVAIQGVEDVDSFLADLVAGERITVRVRRARGSALVPTIEVVAPGGDVAESHPVVRRRGAEVFLRGFAATATGTWTVRIRGADGTEGGYVAQFRTRRAPRLRIAPSRLDSADAGFSDVPVDAVDGSTLHATWNAVGAPVGLLRVVGPDGSSIEPAAPPAKRRQTSALVRLDRGTGPYIVRFGVESGAARWSGSIRVDPPARPSGHAEISSSEPYLASRAQPHDTSPGLALELQGANFATGIPGPRVWFAGREAVVLATSSLGVSILVGVPDVVGELPLDVMVVNPDGQAFERVGYALVNIPRPVDVMSIKPRLVVCDVSTPVEMTVWLDHAAPYAGVDVAIDATGGVGTAPEKIHFRLGESKKSFTFVSGETAGATGAVRATLDSSVESAVTVSDQPSVVSIEPSEVRVAYGEDQTFTVTLSRGATSDVDVAIDITPELGTAPAFVRVPAFTTSGTFTMTAGPSRATGEVTATSGSSVSAQVTVKGSRYLDISGWEIEGVGNFNPGTPITFPQGTILTEGDYVVIGAAATKEQFEWRWGQQLPANAHYFDARKDLVGVIYSTYSPSLWMSDFLAGSSVNHVLRDASGVTVSMAFLPGYNGYAANYVPGAGHAGDPTVCAVKNYNPLVAGAATPGRGWTSPTPGKVIGRGIFLTEWASDVYWSRLMPISLGVVGCMTVSYAAWPTVGNGVCMICGHYIEIHFDELP